MTDFGNKFLNKVSPLLNEDPEMAQGLADVAQEAATQGAVQAKQPSYEKKIYTDYKQGAVRSISAPPMQGGQVQ